MHHYLLSLILLLHTASPGFAQSPAATAPASPSRPDGTMPSEAEAIIRARLLHAAFDGALRVMHRDFFRKGDSKAIPSESLKDVFKTMADEQGVTIRWLASAETVMNVDNKPEDDFQKRALKAITGGEKEVSAVEKEMFRYAGVIVLQNQCLKCHVPERKTLEDRFAALEISMPVKATTAPAKP